MGNQLSLVLRSKLSELERMAQTVSDWCRENSVSAATEFQIILALDEIVSNVIHHGWKNDGEHQVWVRVARLKDELRMEVEDDAMPFNPLEFPAPNMDQPPEERDAGGLGIHLVRQFMDGLEYQRRDGRNSLVMRKKLRDEPPT